MSSATLFTTNTPSQTTYFVHTDGGARGNPGPAAAAFVIQDSQDHLIHQDGRFIGNTTNNVAEYSAVNLALEYLRAHPPTPATYHLIFYLDSQLVAQQLSGIFKIKQPHLLALAQAIHTLIASMPITIDFTTIPRAQNTAADALVNQILDNYPIN